MGWMAKPILLTLTAKADLENISLWLAEKWNLHVLDNFLSLYEAKVLVIAEFPSRYPIIEQSSKLRKAVLTKHTILLYCEKEDHIQIISIFDTRQDPDKITSFVKDI
jgi:plasmid stabilization system protein ParE